MSNKRSKVFSSRGFTLTELLTVIAVISILAALMWTGIGKAMKMAKNSKCVANLHGLHLAFGQFAADWKHWPSLNQENVANPTQYGNQPWYQILMSKGYVPTRLEVRDGYQCLISDMMICPTNETYPGARYKWTAAPYPWVSNYDISSNWGTSNSADPYAPSSNNRLPTLGGVQNQSAIMLIDVKASGLLYPPAAVDWASASCQIPVDLHGSGANALLANGSVIQVSPQAFPALKDTKYWNPRL